MSGMAGLLLATLFAAAALTNQPPLVATPPSVDGSTNLSLKPLSTVSLVYPGRNAGPSQPLAPGAYRTRPYAIIMVVPKSGLDDRCVAGGNNPDSKMPVTKPELRAVPILPSN